MKYALKDYPLWIIHLPEPIRAERMAVYERAFLDTGIGMKPKQYESEALAHKRFARYLKDDFPKVRFLSNLSGEQFSKGQAMNVRDLQSHNSAPDVMIFAARQNYCGLAVEMKAENESPYRKDGTLKKSKHLEGQLEYLEYLRSEGWKAEFAAGSKEAISIAYHYLND